MYINIYRYGQGENQPGGVSKIWVAIGFYTNIIVLVLCWLCSSIIIFATKDLLEMVLNSVAVLFMISIDDEIVSFDDRNNITNMGASGPKSGAAAAASAGLDKIATNMMKLQRLWEYNLVCTVIITVLTIIAPLLTILCYGPAEIECGE